MSAEIRRVKETAPVIQKLTEIFELMHTLGIKIDVSSDVFVVHHEGAQYRMVDLEQSWYVPSHSAIYEFPPGCEYKLLRKVGLPEEQLS
jgi:hypothetical protein